MAIKKKTKPLKKAGKKSKPGKTKPDNNRPALRGGKAKSVKAMKKSLKRGGGVQYLTLIPNTDSITVRFMEEPDQWVETYLHYDADREPRNFPCVEDCEACEAGAEKPTRRYIANAVDKSEDKVVPIVLPVSVVGMLMKKFDRYHTILDRDYDLSKEGAGMDVEYDVNPEGARKMKMDKYTPIDLEEMLLSFLSVSDDDDDDDDDDIEDDEDDDEEVEDENEPPTKKSKAKAKAKSKVKVKAKSKPTPKKKPLRKIKK